jgi:AcrR family transcriptional regulator
MLSIVMGRKPFVRQQILEAAFDLFATEGYEAVSTRQIAAKAEVGAASMFKHFPTKDDLGRELYRVALEPLMQPFQALAERNPTPVEAVTEAVRLLYAAYDTRPRALALLIFPPHVLTPWELDASNPAAVRSILTRLLRCDADLAAIVWGAITGPLQDRYLKNRAGAMAPHADEHAACIARLLT